MVYKDVLEDQIEKLQKLSNINIAESVPLDRKINNAIILSEQINKTVERVKLLQLVK